MSVGVGWPASKTYLEGIVLSIIRPIKLYLGSKIQWECDEDRCPNSVILSYNSLPLICTGSQWLLPVGHQSFAFTVHVYAYFNQISEGAINVSFKKIIKFRRNIQREWERSVWTYPMKTQEPNIYIPTKFTALKMSSNVGILLLQLPQSAIMYTTWRKITYTM